MLLSGFVSQNFKALFGRDLVQEEEITNAIYLGAKGNIARINSSQSHRRFLKGEPSPLWSLLNGTTEYATIVDSYQVTSRSRFRPVLIQLSKVERAVRERIELMSVRYI